MDDLDEPVPFRVASGELLLCSPRGVLLGAARRTKEAADGVRVPAGGAPQAVRVDARDLIGARLIEPTTVEVAELVEPPAPRCGARADRIVRVLRTYLVALVSRAEAVRAVDLLRLLALGSATRTRRLCVLLNPHSGSGSALPLFANHMAPSLHFAGIEHDVTVTSHAGHAIELGKQLDPARYEGVVIVGGDGTVQELLSGLLSRPDWRMLIRRVPLCSVACGTQNALARGLRTTLPEYASWCLIKHKLRPLDAMLVANAAGVRTVSLCGVGFGLAADIAADSERFRALGTFRYAFLKMRHALSLVLGLTRHRASVVMDADIALDDLALALYFAKPLATVRTATSRGRVIIGRLPVEDPEAECDERVMAKLLAEAAVVPPDVRLLRTASMAPGVGCHFHGGSFRAGGDAVTSSTGGAGGRGGGGGDGDRVARLQLSTAALVPFLGSEEAASAVVREAARTVGHRVIRVGGGKLAGADSGGLQGLVDAMDAQQQQQQQQPAPAPVVVTQVVEAAAPSELAGTGGDAASGRGGGGGGGGEEGAAPLQLPPPQQLPPPRHHLPQVSLLSAPAARRAGGGIVTLDEPTAVLVAHMHAAREQAAQRDELTLDAGGATARGGGLAAMALTGIVDSELTGIVDSEQRGLLLPLPPRQPAPAPPPPTPSAGPFADKQQLRGVLTARDARLPGPAPPPHLPPAHLPPAPHATPLAASLALLPLESFDSQDDSGSGDGGGGTRGRGGGGSLVSRQISPRFGQLVPCTRDCAVCRQAGRLRYIGHRRDAITVAAQPAQHASSAAPTAVAGAGGGPPAEGEGDAVAVPVSTAGGAPLDSAVHNAPGAPASAAAAASDVASSLLAASPMRTSSVSGRHCHSASTLPGQPETAGEPRLLRRAAAAALDSGVQAAVLPGAAAALSAAAPPHSLVGGSGGGPTMPAPAAAAVAAALAAQARDGARHVDVTAVSGSALARTALAIVTGEAAASPPPGDGTAPAAPHTYSSAGSWATDIPRGPTTTTTLPPRSSESSSSRSRAPQGSGSRGGGQVAPTERSGSSSREQPAAAADGGATTAATLGGWARGGGPSAGAAAGHRLQPAPPVVPPAAAAAGTAATTAALPLAARGGGGPEGGGGGGLASAVLPQASRDPQSGAFAVAAAGGVPPPPGAVQPPPIAVSAAATAQPWWYPRLPRGGRARAPPTAAPSPPPPATTAAPPPTGPLLLPPGGGCGGAAGTALPPGVHSHTRRNFERRAEASSYITIGLMGVCPDARYAHPSDSYLDLVIARKGGPLASLGLMLR